MIPERSDTVAVSTAIYAPLLKGRGRTNHFLVTKKRQKKWNKNSNKLNSPITDEASVFFEVTVLGTGRSVNQKPPSDHCSHYEIKPV